MNYVERYIQIKNGMVILISGLSGSGRSNVANKIKKSCGERECYNSGNSGRTILAEEIERDFKIKLISLENYCNENNVKIVEMYDGTKIHDWEDIDIYDWDKFNDDIKEYKQHGVVCYGDYFPTDKLKFDVDFHINIYISKENLLSRRLEYIEKNAEKCPELADMVKNNKFEIIIKKYTYPYFVKYTKESNIDKRLDSGVNTSDELYDQAFEYIINMIQKSVNEYDSINKENKKSKKNNFEI